MSKTKRKGIAAMITYPVGAIVLIGIAAAVVVTIIELIWGG